MIAGMLSVALFIGGGIVTQFNTYAAIGLYVSSPLPIILYKVIRRQPETEDAMEAPKEDAPGDPGPPV